MVLIKLQNLGKFSLTVVKQGIWHITESLLVWFFFNTF